MATVNGPKSFRSSLLKEGWGRGWSISPTRVYKEHVGRKLKSVLLHLPTSGSLGFFLQRALSCAHSLKAAQFVVAPVGSEATTLNVECLLCPRCRPPAGLN